MAATVFVNLFWILALATAVWIFSLWKRDASIADPAWGLGFVVIAWLTAMRLPAVEDRGKLLLALTTIWGLRLGGYLLWRNRQHGEDRRYQAMRQHHGKHFWWRSWFTVFGLQAILLWWIAFPLQWGIASSADPLTAVDGIFVALWFWGFAWEAIGDWQLTRFQADSMNRGKVLNTGLWRYTRHPNYYGDFCVWWGIFGLAAMGGAWHTVLSPVTMSLLLLYVSGVRLTEQTIKTRRPEYAEYQRQTNAFFPGPPRK